MLARLARSSPVWWILLTIPFSLALPQDSMNRAKRPGHETLFPLIGPSAMSDERTFQDRIIRIEFLIFTAFNFHLVNRSNSSIEIDWDRCSYVDPLGSAHRVIHKEVRFRERDRPQAPTVMPIGSSVDDILVPVDHIEFTNGKWKVNEPFRLTEITQPGGLYQGMTFHLPIAIRLRSTVTTYDFSFRIPKDLKRR